MTAQNLILAIIVLQVLDVISTLYAFRNGAVEGNPVMSRLTNKLGKGTGLLLPKALYGIMAWWIITGYSVHVNWVYGLFAVYTLVILNNTRLALRKTK